MVVSFESSVGTGPSSVTISRCADQTSLMACGTLTMRSQCPRCCAHDCVAEPQHAVPLHRCGAATASHCSHRAGGTSGHVQSRVTGWVLTEGRLLRCKSPRLQAQMQGAGESGQTSGVPMPAPRGSPLGPNQWFCGAPVVRPRMPLYVVPFTVFASTCRTQVQAGAGPQRLEQCLTCGTLLRNTLCGGAEGFRTRPAGRGPGSMPETLAAVCLIVRSSCIKDVLQAQPASGPAAGTSRHWRVLNHWKHLATMTTSCDACVDESAEKGMQFCCNRR